jgi:superfamily I DNA/RNA helicase
MDLYRRSKGRMPQIEKLTYDEYIKKFKVILNEQQSGAVCSVAGPAILLAVPGSGKTTVITARIGYMIYCEGIMPESILTLTYSVAAANDMRARFGAKFGDEMCGRLDFRTIHSFCAGVLRRYQSISGRNVFPLIAEPESARVLQAIYREINGEYATENTMRDIRTRLTYCRNIMMPDSEIKKTDTEIKFYDIFHAYKNYKKSRRVMDYDDQLEYTLTIFRKYPDLLDYYSDKYRYINVDEAQDTSKIQHEIIRLLAAKYKNIFMVGDEDQSIYGFRAAYPQALLEFDNAYPGARVLVMETNYRSTAEIVQRADGFIKQNKNRHQKNMVSAGARGQAPRNTVLGDCRWQYNYLLKIARDCRQQTAVLYRNNDSAIPLIDLLEKNKVPYRVRENDALFFTHYTVTDISAIMKFAFESDNIGLFSDIYYKIGCGISRQQAENAAAAAKARPGENILEIILKNNICEAWQRGRISDAIFALSQIPEQNSFTAIRNIMSRLGYGEYLQKINADAGKTGTLLALANQNEAVPDFLLRLTELYEIISRGRPGNKSEFILSTIHSSKGLEYERVILIDVKDGILPSVIIPPDGKLTEEEAAELEEERRLFYVGVTRAKKQLEIFSCEREYGKNCDVPSFVRAYFGLEDEKKGAADPARETKSGADPALYVQYTEGVVVKHTVFGSGVITTRDNDFITVKFFRRNEIKKLSLNLCLQWGLLKFD